MSLLQTRVELRGFFFENYSSGSSLLHKWVHKRVHSLENCQQALASAFGKWQYFAKIENSGTTVPATGSSEVITSGRCITTFTVIQLSTRLVSVVVFCGTFIYNEASRGLGLCTLELEPFAAVGQWGNLGVVLLVLLAAAIRRVWGGGGAKSAVVEVRRLEEGGEESSKVKILYADKTL